MEKEELYNKIKNISEIQSINNSHLDINLFQKGVMIVMQYKEEGGEQQEAYDTLHSLYKNYANNKEDEAKMDYVADLLDCVCGWIGNEQYKLWNKYPFDIK